MEKSPSRWWDWPSALLLAVAIVISTWRLAVTDWTENLNYVSNLALAGTLLGLALGASAFGKRGVRILAILYTLVMIPRQLIASYPGDVYLGEQLGGVGGRLLFSISEYAANKPVRDALFFVALVSILYWFIGLCAGYYLVRHGKTLAAILPAGIAVLAVHQFDHASAKYAWLVAAYLFLALTLLGRGQYLHNRVAWLKRGVHLSPEAGPDLSVGAALGAGALIILAWNLPLNFVTPALAEPWERLTYPWRASRDRLSRAFAAIEGEGDRAEYFRNTLPLGNRATQDNQAVFKAYVPPEAMSLPRLYWRARVYDHYANGFWTASKTDADEFSPQSDILRIPDNEKRKEYEFTFTAYTHRQAILYLAAQPLWVSRPVDVSAFDLPDGGQDVVAMEAFPFLESGETYHTRSAIANPSIQELRDAGEEYPDWVKERYLQLPENFSQNVVGFATQVTFGLKTPYDKAQALTTVLRAQTTYAASITLPPEGADLMEWFLFEGREGYCNYYATAETLMLRALGIPARMAVGFSQGEATDMEGEFIVARRHAHAWPEVYFPGYGWIEFEPTGNQEPLERSDRPGRDPSNPDAIEEGDNPQNNPTPEPPNENAEPLASGQGALSNFMPILLAGSGILALLAVAYYFLNARFQLTTRAAAYVLSAADRRGERSPAWVRNAALYLLADAFERAFHPVNQSLRWLEKSPAQSSTPAQRAASLAEVLPGAAGEIAQLLREYQAEKFSPRGGDVKTARRAGLQIWRKGLLAAIRRSWE